MSEGPTLSEVTIRGLGVIESSSVEFGSGLTVLTGETGAGKTMVLSALQLLLGGKSDTDLIRNGHERLTVVGRLVPPPHLKEALDEAGIELEDGAILIQRTISVGGKSKLVINGVPVTAAQVAQIAAECIEILGQSSSYRLGKSSTQLKILDDFANNGSLLSDYQKKFEEYREFAARIAELRSSLAKRESEIAEIQRFLADFQEIDPTSGEFERIEQEIAKLDSVEFLNAQVTGALNILEGEDVSALSLLQQIRKLLEATKDRDPALDDITEKVTESFYQLEEAGGDLARYLASLEADPVRFDFLQHRKAKITTLLKKYGRGSDRLIAYEELVLDGARSIERLNDLSGGDERLQEMEGELSALLDSLRAIASELSSRRSEAGQRFSEEVTEEMRALAMPHATLRIEVAKSSGKSFSDFNATGLDEVKFLFSSHQDGPALALGKSASGGEMSRVLLALEMVSASHSPMPTYIFDEIDAGVGGKAATEVGRALARLARNAQVIAITHLAQVAAWANHHLVVEKSEAGSVTESSVYSVSAEERPREIARMLSGLPDSQAAQEHALELLKLASQSMIS